MTNNQKISSMPPKNAASVQSKPNEKYGLHFSSSIKITDLGTGKVILQKRCN